ncbi:MULTISPECIES: lysophospholipid acyltransferase family protein [unclassified Rhodosalinus]|uniref:lysophospholipid acyltransferase family protein n=1 Tax=unclassified Rhodosalinus TaxID=2630183 RepID=UPI0035257851
MSRTWRGAEPPADRGAPGALGWALVALRGVPLALVVFGGLALLLSLRLAERPIFGPARPVTPWITQGVCRVALVLLGVRYRQRGRPMTGEGAMVANHASWADIFALNAGTRLYFVAKAEVAGWPGIGWLARATGTLFVARDPRQAAAQRVAFETRLLAGHRLLFFPEGTSTDGRRVLPFKPTLFEALFNPALAPRMRVQPVSVIWRAPAGEDPRFYGWWGDMDFGPHLLKLLATPGRGAVEVVWHPPLDVSAFEGRKVLAATLEERVRGGIEAGLA